MAHDNLKIRTLCCHSSRDAYRSRAVIEVGWAVVSHELRAEDSISQDKDKASPVLRGLRGSHGCSPQPVRCA
jgi:hypothetical protein